MCLSAESTMRVKEMDPVQFMITGLLLEDMNPLGSAVQVLLLEDMNEKPVRSGLVDGQLS